MIDRRDEIADEFKKHFHHFGFKKTSVDEVAAQLHISKKTIYEYFESKEDIFEFVIIRESKKIGAQMGARLQKVPAGNEQIQILIQMIFENVRTYISASRNLDFHNQDEIATRAFQTAYEDILRKAVEDGKKIQKFSATIGDQEISFIFAVILEAISSLRKDPGKKPESSLVAMVLKMLA